MSDTQPSPQREGRFYALNTSLKAEGASSVDTTSTAPAEDSFHGLYMSGDQKSDSVQIIAPPFNPSALRNLVLHNNVLSQCIAAMVVSIDGTGHTIESTQEDGVKQVKRQQTKNLPEGEVLDSDEFEEVDLEKQALVDFFDEPFPGKSMVTIRRLLRDDLETTGNGYLEVARNALGEIVLLNHLPSDDMRIVRYDDPVPVKVKVVRRGKEIAVSIPMRERRYAQMVNGKVVYFREFGSSRDLNKDTGKWAAQGQRLPFNQRAGEVIHFTVLKDSKSPYGLPRWINQLPSVLGSRKAEEFNLEFFDHGGLPPVLVIVQGGYLGDSVRESLEAHLSGKAKSKQRAAVVEATASSGSLDSSGTVKVTVERFGAERQQDSMFQNYDKNAEEHVRTAFRLPPMFIGRAQDYNFATAMTGYLVAEAQVFATERLHFDEVMWRICTSMGVKNHMFKSKPLSLVHSENQLKALELVLEKDIADKEDVLHAINTLSGLSLEYKEPEPTPDPLAPTSDGDPLLEEPQINDPLPVAKTERMQELLELASRWAHTLGLTGSLPVSKDEAQKTLLEVSSLSPEEAKLVNASLATVSLSNADTDLQGLAGLCGVAAVKEL